MKFKKGDIVIGNFFPGKTWLNVVAVASDGYYKTHICSFNNAVVEYKGKIEFDNYEKSFSLYSDIFGGEI